MGQRNTKIFMFGRTCTYKMAKLMYMASRNFILLIIYIFLYFFPMESAAKAE